MPSLSALAQSGSFRGNLLPQQLTKHKTPPSSYPLVFLHKSRVDTEFIHLKMQFRAFCVFTGRHSFPWLVLEYSHYNWKRPSLLRELPEFLSSTHQANPQSPLTYLFSPWICLFYLLHLNRFPSLRGREKLADDPRFSSVLWQYLWTISPFPPPFFF